jgi:HD-GYP domain-containing protein (c-di-GMP phosphodiesterase class II)
MDQTQQQLRLAELVAALSIATDLGTGHPMERALRACLFALRLGEALKCDETTLAETFYVTLLRYAGCAADARHRAALFGDEIALGPDIDAVELWKLEPMLAFLFKHGLDRLPPDQLEALMATGVQRSVEAAIANCEIGQSIAVRLGLGKGVVGGLGDVFERWDGGGVPGKVRGELISFSARIAMLALDAEVYFRLGGESAVLDLVRQRSAGQYDPALVACVLAHPRLCSCFATPDPWDEVLREEPGSRPILTGTQVDDAVRAIADLVDVRTPFMSGHSVAVAELCAAIGLRLGLPAAELVILRRAAYIHDAGAMAISVSIWDKAAPLSAGEWERVRLHPYYTERILARSPLLRELGKVAVLHHERLDGSGYHRQIPAPFLPLPARILAVAEAYRGMLEERPHRVAMAPDQAASDLRSQASRGLVDPDVVTALLAVVGHTGPAPKRRRPAGLTDRELEVLILVARGMTNKQIARSLIVSPATVDHHVRHIYTKIDCSTRLAATMFALEHRLLA